MRVAFITRSTLYNVPGGDTIQIDQTAAVAPSLDLVPWTRLGPSYRRSEMTQAAERDGTLFELNGFVRPMADLRLYLADMQTWPTREEAREWLEVNDPFRRDILDRLEAKGFVKRERSVDDRRQVFVSVTPTGAALVQSAPSPLQDVLVGALHRLTLADQEEIAASLEAVVELMQAREIDAAPILEVGELKRTLDRD